MPLSEVPQAASKARTQFRMRNFMSDNDFTELVCQNDQIVMQNHSDKIQEKDSNLSKTNNRFDRLRSIDSDVDELLHVLPGTSIGLNTQLEETSYPDAVLMNFSIGHENISIEKGQKFDVSTNKCHALVVSSSSFGSGSSSSDKLYDLEITKKAKDQDGEECSKQNHNSQADSVTSKKSGKRTRAADVHNLSERRRRDRINERMRALQELIPNCNKVDRATMLDEAIEYLKNLQLQVQMMYMNNGICVPHYSPMEIGMGYMYGMQMHSSQLLPPRPSMQFSRPLHGIRSQDAQMKMNDQALNYAGNGSST